jgi:uncharacterized protein
LNKHWWVKGVFTAAVLGIFLGQTASVTAQEVKPDRELSIVIDDFGNGMEGTKEMLELPAHLTIAVMPFLPTTQKDAKLAHEKGHEVIVHLPMEPVRGKKSWLGPKAITTDLSAEEIRSRVQEAIDDVPYAVGVNNHMGSKATADERVMTIVLEVCKERGLFFLDSRTSKKSVIGKVANGLGVPTISNHLFLDEVYTVRHISKQMERLKKHIADHDGCVAIGHVGPPGKKTAEVLRRSLPAILDKAEIVPLTKLAKDYKLLD